jgi:hypothetical protein
VIDRATLESKRNDYINGITALQGAIQAIDDLLALLDAQEAQQAQGAKHDETA